MRLSRIDIRFFKSFNFDYELKARETSEPAGWEDVSHGWFPFVKVELDPLITAVVGANESGKSQLLTGIKGALTGTSIRRADFCRYSEMYSVKAGEVRFPEFGATFVIESEEDAAAVNAIEPLNIGDSFTLYRPGNHEPFVVIGREKHTLTAPALAILERSIPTFHELRTDLAIPDSVSIAELAGRERRSLDDRAARSRLLAELTAQAWGAAADVGAAIFPHLAAPSLAIETGEGEKRRAEFELARQLLVDIAKIDAHTFEELQGAIASGREGQVEGLVGAMNSAIKENLNFQRWWSQDKNFDVMVEAREHELAFTIRDRTAAKYSFDERSQGLRFFLSYFVQLTAHRSSSSKVEVLLLDEPDAYLSSTGQQDLLRVLEDYASPEAGGPRNQVVYVTHSPFLINKNAAQRIRVLDKGAEDEGTRVVKDVARNHYEPLRSSLGAFVAETAFIGGKNLFVEGAADQVLLAGVSTSIAELEQTTADVLDLNEVTVVACGSADSIPYMVYLARGRDVIKPPCVALLDGDKAGRLAQKLLQRGEVRKSRILRDEFIVRLDEWAASQELVVDDLVKVEEIEDLIPLEVARHAALNYLGRFVDRDSVNTDTFSREAIRDQLSTNGGRVWDAVEAAYAESFPNEHVEKVGFAREVVALLSDADQSQDFVVDVIEMQRNFRLLLVHLSRLLEEASRFEENRRSDARLRRVISGFVRDFPQGMKRFRARALLQEIESTLGESEHGDEMRLKLAKLSRDFDLGDTSVEQVPNFEAFRQGVRALAMMDRLLYQDAAGTRSTAVTYPAAPIETSPTASQSTETAKPSK